VAKRGQSPCAILDVQDDFEYRARGARCVVSLPGAAMVAAREKGSEAMLIKGLSAALVAATLLAPIAIAGPVDVNTADAKTLARELQGIGMAKAEAIVSYREKNGPFKGADDLAKVKGLGKKLVEQNKANLKFESAAKAGG
jgi:competence protein ComEA